MYSKGYIDYKAKISKDVVSVDNRLLKGASMTECEWFDFNVKSSLLGYQSRGARLYRLMNRKLVKLAEIYAEALHFMADIEANGFTMKEYSAMVKYLARKMNKLIWFTPAVKASTYDKNGVFFISMVSGKKITIDYSVVSKAEAQNGLLCLMEYSTDLVDVFPMSKEFRKYVNGYLKGELHRIVAHISPMPFLDLSVNSCKEEPNMVVGV